MQAKEPDSRLKIIQKDFEDKDLYKVNQVINDLYSKIDSTRINGKFYERSQFEDIWLNTDRDPNTLNDKEVLNLGELRRLGTIGGGTTIVNTGGGGGGGGGGTTSVIVQYPPTTDYLDAVSRHIDEKVGETISVMDFGATGDGVTDDTLAFSKAVLAVIDSGRGKRILIPAVAKDKFYAIGSKIEISNYSSALGLYIPIQFEGEGQGSVVKRTATLAANEGLFNVHGEDVTFSNFLVDGDVTTPTGLLYSSITTPMDDALSRNTSFWLHGPCKNVTFTQMTIQHTGGYAILVDASSNDSNHNYDSNSYDIWNTRILHCDFLNNRPHLFGTSGGDLNYGSWTGGVFVYTYGQQTGSNYLSTTYNTLLEGCFFRGNYGNCFWSWLSDFDILHTDFRALGNTFIDNGLDGILFGGVTGGTAGGNRFRRTGYIPATHSTDISVTNTGVPKWLADHNATALDTSGIAKGVAYANNTFISTNGGDMDLDGFCDGQVTGNVCFTPRTSDPEYTEDSISISGPAANGVTWSYGIQPSDTYGDDFGAVNVSITGNSFINKYGGAIRLAACRGAYVSGNNIDHPAAPGYGPIILFNIIDHASVTRTTHDTVVTGNTIRYAPAAAGAAIAEFGAALGFTAFNSGDKNWVHDNQIIGTNAYEFMKDAATDSTGGVTVSLSYSALAARSESFISRGRSVATGKNFDYLLFQSKTSSTTLDTGYLSDYAIIGIGGYVSTSGTAVSWVSGDDFSTFSNGGSIVINGTTKTISTVNSPISITLTTSAGSLTAVTFSDPVYHQGSPQLVVGDGTYGSISTGNRSILGFDDTIATSALYADGMMVLTDATLTASRANKLSDNYGLIKYDSTAKAFYVSTGATAGVRTWTALAGSSVGGATTQVQYNNAGSFAGSANFTWVNASQVLTIAGVTTTAAINVTTAYIDSAEGFRSTGTATDTVNIPSGGVTGKWLIATDSVFWIEEAAPAVSGAGQSRIYMDSTSHTLKVSQNGAAYVALVGSGSVAGSNTQVQYNNSSAFGASANFTWTNASQLLTITGTATTANSILSTGYIQADGFAVPNTASAPWNNTDVIQAKAGGVTARWLITTDSVFWIEEAAPAVSSAGQSRVYMDSTSHLLRVSQNGAAYVNLVGTGSVAGADTYVQYNNAGSFGAEADFAYNYTTNILTVTSGVVTETHNSTATGSTISFKNNNNNFSVDGNGNVSAVGVLNLEAPSLTNSLTITRTSATARKYGLAVNSSGAFLINDVTGGTTLVTLSSSSLASAQQVSAPFFTATNTSGATTAFQTSSASLSISGAGDITSSGFVNITGTNPYRVSGTTIVDSSRNATFVGLTFGGSSSLVQGSTTRIDASGNATFVALTFGGSSAFVQGSTTRIDSSGNATFTTTTSGLVNSSVGTGATLAFQAGSGLFQAYGNGNVNGLNFNCGASGSFQVNGSTAIDSSKNGTFVALTASGAISGSGTGSYFDTSYSTVGGNPYRLRGAGLIDNGGVWISAGGIDMPAGIGATSFNIHSGATGKTGSFTVAGTVYTFTTGILTSIV